MYLILIELIYNDDLLNGEGHAGEFVGWEYPEKGKIIKYKENNKIVKKFKVIKTKFFIRKYITRKKVILKVYLEEI